MRTPLILSLARYYQKASMRCGVVLWFLPFIFGINNLNAQGGDTTATIDPVIYKLAANQRDFKTLSARIRMTWNDGEAEQEFNANVRIQKDSLIWMSMGLMGMEGMRLLITRDSVRIINKLANEYSVRDFNFMKTWLTLPVNFGMLQQIIAGGRIPIEEKAAITGHPADSLTLVYLESDKMYEEIWVDTTHYTAKKILLKDKLVKQDMEITFDAYNYTEAKPFSYQRSIVIHRDGTTATLHMDFMKVSFDEALSYPFEVSEKIKRVE
jgi:outer membrane lipoprotein-sorting protein